MNEFLNGLKTVLPDVLNVVVIAVLGYLGKVIGEYFKAKGENASQTSNTIIDDMISSAAIIGIRAAEQKFGEGKNEEKKAYVMNILRKKFPLLEDIHLDTAVEGLLKSAKNSLGNVEN